MYKQILDSLKKEKCEVTKKFDKSMQIWGKTPSQYKALGNILNSESITIVGPVTRVLPKKIIK